MKPAPTRKERPTYKVDSFLKHLQQVSMKAWRLGQNISGDKQTIGFQGRHADKLQITYKAEGDGFQCHALADSGFTWTFFFSINQHRRNGPRKATHHCILVFWECLTNLKTSSTIVGSIICICLPGLQRQHGHIPTK